MKVIRSQVQIAAGTERVWNLLTDFANYRNWNPSIPAIRGEAALDNQIRLCIRLAGNCCYHVRARITACEPPRFLRWSGKLLSPHLFQGRHSFLIEPLEPDDGGCVRLTQQETFTGILVPFLGWWLNGPVCRGFEAAGEALKRRAEVEDGR